MSCRLLGFGDRIGVALITKAAATALVGTEIANMLERQVFTDDHFTGVQLLDMECLGVY